MNDVLDYVRVVLVLLVTIVMYVLVMQVANDVTCPSLDRHASLGSGFIKFISLCWW